MHTTRSKQSKRRITVPLRLKKWLKRVGFTAEGPSARNPVYETRKPIDGRMWRFTRARYSMLAENYERWGWKVQAVGSPGMAHEEGINADTLEEGLRAVGVTLDV